MMSYVCSICGVEIKLHNHWHHAEMPEEPAEPTLIEQVAEAIDHRLVYSRAVSGYGREEDMVLVAKAAIEKIREGAAERLDNLDGPDSENIWKIIDAVLGGSE